MPWLDKIIKLQLWLNNFNTYHLFLSTEISKKTFQFFQSKIKLFICKWNKFTRWNQEAISVSLKQSPKHFGIFIHFTISTMVVSNKVSQETHAMIINFLIKIYIYIYINYMIKRVSGKKREIVNQMVQRS